MLSSSSDQKFQNGKKTKKRYQKFKGNQEKDNAVEKSGLPNETSEKRPGFVDLKDFPELKGSGKQNKNLLFESKTNSCRSRSDKPWQSVVTSGNGRKPNEAFPALVKPENIKKDDCGKYNTTAQAAPKNVTSEATNTVVASMESGTSNKEKHSTKKTPVQPHRNPNKKKRSEPVFINFQDILATNKTRKRTVKSQHKILRNRFQRHRDNIPLSGNFLDSSNPKRNRGKHREIKKKKLSNLKTTIIKERIIKSKLREMAVAAQFDSSSFKFLDRIDFNKEIKIYLNELNNKKLKNSEAKKSKINENVNTEKVSIENRENLGTKLVEKEENSENVPSVKEKIIPQIGAEGGIKFTSKFREYCDNIITPDLNLAVATLIEELIKLQDRVFLRDPIKAKARKRHVSGLREVKKYLTLKKVKMIIIAPNLEKLQMEGSVYDSINELKSMSDSQNVPYGFALDRYKLGRHTKKNVPVSAFAVLSYDGVEALYEHALSELLEAKKKFSELVKPKAVEGKEDVNSKLLSTLVSAFEEFLQIPKEAPLDVS